MAPPFSSGSSQISLSLINSHSHTSLSKRSDAPKTFAANGIPLHFWTISFPIFTKSADKSSSSIPQARTLNKDQHSPSFKNGKLYHGSVRIIEATFSRRVVTRIELPLAPQVNDCFNFPQVPPSLFQTSSKTSKNRFPLSNSFR
ncbi:hypothetical protein FRX31_030214 [Thalictrum thalictroides]|uniref:Uncharacterized protein n=1 Tax=Thalictrum thalictroides TaxID=46969 RepID=A0A7J6V608_THATH|nr:hypothetical protein FRX31_030214 [Thalictrum thalictroides]